MKLAFITMEGVESSGKSIQAKLLTDWLKENGLNPLLTIEPGGTPFGKTIRELLLNGTNIDPITELFLYLSDRKEHIIKVILPAMKEGRIVVSDRYYDSTFAYQGGGRGIDKKWIESLMNYVVQSVIPDITFLIDISPEISLSRIKGKDRIEKEEMAFHKRVREAYLKRAREFPDRIRVINGARTIREIQDDIRNQLKERLVHK